MAWRVKSLTDKILPRRRAKPLSHWVRPWVERLEERINPDGSGPPTPPTTPASVFSSITSLPVIGPSLPAILAPLAVEFGSDVVTDIQTGNYTATGSNPTTYSFPTMHAVSLTAVPFTLNVGSFLTLNSAANENISVWVDAYYNLVFSVNPDGTITDVDQSLRQRHDNVDIVSTNPAYPPGAAPAVTVPDTTFVAVVSATVPTGFSATGKMAKQFDVTFTDAAQGAKGFTNFIGALGLNLASVLNGTTATPQGVLFGNAHVDGFLEAKLSGLDTDAPFISRPTEIKADWSFNGDTVAPAPADPSTLGTLPYIEFDNVSVNLGSVLDLTGAIIQDVQDITNSVPMQAFLGFMDATVPVFNVSVHTIAEQFHLINADQDDALSFLEFVNNLHITNEGSFDPVNVGGFRLSDPRQPNPQIGSITPPGGGVPQSLQDLYGSDLTGDGGPGSIANLNQKIATLPNAVGLSEDQQYGLHFLPLEDPDEYLFPVLAGQNKTLVTFKTYPLDLSFDLGAFLSHFGVSDLLGVAGLSLNGQLSVHLALSAGFDMSGFQKYDTDSTQSSDDVLHGFYFDAANTGASATANMQLVGGQGIQAEGDINANVVITPKGVPDQDDPNKLRLDGSLKNPWDIFGHSGKVTVSAKVDVGFNTFLGRVTLLSINVANKTLLDLDSPQTIQYSNDTMDGAIPIHTSATDETITVRQVEVPDSSNDPMNQEYDQAIEVVYPDHQAYYFSAHFKADSSGNFQATTTTNYNVVATDGAYAGGKQTIIVENVLNGNGTPLNAVLIGGTDDDDLEYHGTGHAVIIGGAGNNIVSAAPDNGAGGGSDVYGAFVDPTHREFAQIPVIPGWVEDEFTALSGSNETSGNSGATAPTAAIVGSGGPDVLVGGPGLNTFIGDTQSDALMYGAGIGNTYFLTEGTLGNSTSTVGIYGSDTFNDTATDTVVLRRSAATAANPESLSFQVLADDTSTDSTSIGLDVFINVPNAYAVTSERVNNFVVQEYGSSMDIKDIAGDRDLRLAVQSNPSDSGNQIIVEPASTLDFNKLSITRETDALTGLPTSGLGITRMNSPSIELLDLTSKDSLRMNVPSGATEIDDLQDVGLGNVQIVKTAPFSSNINQEITLNTSAVYLGDVVNLTPDTSGGFQVGQSSTDPAVTAHVPTIDIQGLSDADSTTLDVTAPDGLFATSNIVNVDASTVAGALKIAALGDATVGDSVTLTKVGPHANVLIDGQTSTSAATIGAGRLDQIQHDVTVRNAAVFVDDSTLLDPSIFTLDDTSFTGWTALGGSKPTLYLDTISAFTATGGMGDRFDVEATPTSAANVTFDSAGSRAAVYIVAAATPVNLNGDFNLFLAWRLRPDGTVEKIEHLGSLPVAVTYRFSSSLSAAADVMMDGALDPAGASYQLTGNNNLTINNETAGLKVTVYGYRSQDLVDIELPGGNVDADLRNTSPGTIQVHGSDTFWTAARTTPINVTASSGSGSMTAQPAASDPNLFTIAPVGEAMLVLMNVLLDSLLNDSLVLRLIGPAGNLSVIHAANLAGTLDVQSQGPNDNVKLAEVGPNTITTVEGNDSTTLTVGNGDLAAIEHDVTIQHVQLNIDNSASTAGGVYTLTGSSTSTFVGWLVPSLGRRPTLTLNNLWGDLSIQAGVAQEFALDGTPANIGSATLYNGTSVHDLIFTPNWSARLNASGDFALYLGWQVQPTGISQDLKTLTGVANVPVQFNFSSTLDDPTDLVMDGDADPAGATYSIDGVGNLHVVNQTLGLAVTISGYRDQDQVHIHLPGGNVNADLTQTGRGTIVVDSSARLAGTNAAAPDSINVSARAGAVTMQTDGADNSILRAFTSCCLLGSMPQDGLTLTVPTNFTLGLAPIPHATDNNLNLDAGQLRGTFQVNVLDPDYIALGRMAFGAFVSVSGILSADFAQSTLTLAGVNPQLAVTIVGTNAIPTDNFTVDMQFNYQPITYLRNKADRYPMTSINFGAGVLANIQGNVTAHNAVLTVDDRNGATPGILTLTDGVLSGWATAAGLTQLQLSFSALQGDFVVIGSGVDQFDVENTPANAPQTLIENFATTTSPPGVYVMAKTVMPLYVTGDLSLYVGRRLHADGTVENVGQIANVFNNQNQFVPFELYVSPGFGSGYFLYENGQVITDGNTIDAQLAQIPRPIFYTYTGTTQSDLVFDASNEVILNGNYGRFTNGNAGGGLAGILSNAAYPGKAQLEFLDDAIIYGPGAAVAYYGPTEINGQGPAFLVDNPFAAPVHYYANASSSDTIEVGETHGPLDVHGNGATLVQLNPTFTLWQWHDSFAQSIYQVSDGSFAADVTGYSLLDTITANINVANAALQVIADIPVPGGTAPGTLPNVDLTGTKLTGLLGGGSVISFAGLINNGIGLSILLPAHAPVATVVEDTPPAIATSISTFFTTIGATTDGAVDVRKTTGALRLGGSGQIAFGALGISYDESGGGAHYNATVLVGFSVSSVSVGDGNLQNISGPIVIPDAATDSIKATIDDRYDPNPRQVSMPFTEYSGLAAYPFVESYSFSYELKGMAPAPIYLGANFRSTVDLAVYGSAGSSFTATNAPPMTLYAGQGSTVNLDESEILDPALDIVGAASVQVTMTNAMTAGQVKVEDDPARPQDPVALTINQFILGGNLTGPEFNLELGAQATGAATATLTEETSELWQVQYPRAVTTLTVAYGSPFTVDETVAATTTIKPGVWPVTVTKTTNPLQIDYRGVVPATQSIVTLGQAGSMQSIQGEVDVLADGIASSLKDSVILDDSADSTSRNIAVIQDATGATVIAGLSTAVTKISGTEVVATVRGSSGSTLTAPDATNTWQITGTDRGALNGNVLYQGIPNLQGGGLGDTFAFQPGAAVSGNVDGGLGSDTLDYSGVGLTSADQIDLPHGKAPHIAGAAINIENVLPFTMINPGDQTSLEGAAFSLSLSTLGGGSAGNFSAVGLPAGLSINAATGLITGTIQPPAAIPSSFHVTVSANDGTHSASTTFTWTVTATAPNTAVLADPVSGGTLTVTSPAGTTLSVSLAPAPANVTIASDTTWSVSSDLAGKNVVGNSEYVVLNNTYPYPNPAGAFNFNYNAVGWQATSASNDPGGAAWIWAPGISLSDSPNAGYYFTKSFNVAAPVTGYLYLAVDDFAVLYVNGVEVGTATGHNSLTRYFVSLSAGQNTIEVYALNEPNGSPNYAGDPAGVVFGGTLSPSTPPPAHETFPLGVLSFTVAGVAPGSTAQLIITPPAGVDSTDYYKYGITPAQRTNHWYDFLYQQPTDSDDASTTGAVWQNGQIVLNLVDGGRGDDDLTANGTIVDMGGPAMSDLAPQITGPSSVVQGTGVEFSANVKGSNAAGAASSWLVSYESPSGWVTFASGSGATIDFTPLNPGAYDVHLAVASQDGSDSAGIDTQLTVTAAPADHLWFTAPAQAVAGGKFSVTVSALNPFGRLDPSVSGSVFLAIANSTHLSAPILAQMQNGVATFNNVAIAAAGSYSLITGGPGDLLDAKTTLPVIAPPHFGVAVASGNGSGQVFVTVTALGATNKTVTNYLGTIHFTSTDLHAGLPADYAFQSTDNGSHTFTVSLSTPGSQTVSVRDASLATAVGTSKAETVVGTRPTAVVDHLILSGFPATVVSGTSHMVTVAAVNVYGTTLTTFSGQVELSSSDSTFNPQTVSFVKGLAQITVKLTTLGSASLRAALLNVLDSGGPSGADSNISVVSPATHLGVTASAIQVTAGNQVVVTVRALTAAGQTDVLFNDALIVTTSDPNATVTAHPLTNGMQTFTITFVTAAQQTITVQDLSRSKLIGPNPIVNVQSGSVTQLVLTGFPLATVAGVPHNFIVTAEDAYGNRVVNGFQDTVSVAGGSYKFKTTEKGIHQFTTSLTQVGSSMLTAADLSNPGVTSAVQSNITVVSAAVAIIPDPADITDSDLVIVVPAAGGAVVIAASNGAGTTVSVSINGKVQTVPASPNGLDHILVYAQAGTVVVNEVAATINKQRVLVAIPAVIFGGAGTNTLNVAGSSADNVVIGGAGRDSLTGGTGRDILIGGGGPDTIRAGSGDDILLSGATRYDTSLAAMLAFMAEWSRQDATYEQRVQHLLGNLAGGLNGSNQFTPAGIARNTSVAQLFGGVGTDWFWSSFNTGSIDGLFNTTPGETLTLE